MLFRIWDQLHVRAGFDTIVRFYHSVSPLSKSMKDEMDYRTVYRNSLENGEWLDSGFPADTVVKHCYKKTLCNHFPYIVLTTLLFVILLIHLITFFPPIFSTSSCFYTSDFVAHSSSSSIHSFWASTSHSSRHTVSTPFSSFSSSPTHSISLLRHTLT